jgi:hypothetical protein
MSIFNFISNIFKPAVDLVDELHTSDEEKLKLQSILKKVENDFNSKVLEYESRLMEAQASIIRSEAGGQSWLQRNWRPIVMLSFLLLVICDSFDLLAFRLADQALMLLQIGLGGYVIGRSAEKIIPGLMNRRQGMAVG